MHRKYVAARRNKARANKGNKMVQSESAHVPEFISRVANIPVVHSALGYATDAYDKAKVQTLSSVCNAYHAKSICLSRI